MPWIAENRSLLNSSRHHFITIMTKHGQRCSVSETILLCLGVAQVWHEKSAMDRQYP